MSPARTAATLLLIVVGYALVVRGQLATVYLDQAINWAVVNLGSIGRWFVNLTWSAFPPGAFLAVCSILMGTLLVAVGIAAASRPAPFELQGSDVKRSTSGLLRSWILLGAATALAAVTLYICRLPQPSNLAVATWAVSLFCGGLAFAWMDQAADTTIAWRLGGWTEVAVVMLVSLLSLAVVAHDLMSWRWSGTPDETHFFGVAKALANGTAQRFLLSERGVFEVHPTLSSVYQALFLMVFGISGFSWRLSSAVALAGSVPLVYLLARWLWNKRVAVVAAALFGTTPVAIGFAHLGYNNTQAYPVVIGSLVLLVWAHRSGSVAGMYLAGCLAGLGFYTYYPARLTLLLVIVLGWSLGALPLFRRGRVRTVALGIGFLLALVPVAAHPLETFGRMSQFTRFTEGGALRATDVASTWQLIASVDVWELLNQSFLSVIYSVYFVGPHHFQWPPVVDVVSGPLTLVGLWLCVGGCRRRNARFLLLTFVVAAVLIGGTSHYFRPPLTRLLFLSPFAALLAAVALDRFATALANITRSHRFASIFAAAVTTLAVLWAVGWTQYNVRYRYHGYGDGTTTELVRLALQQPDDVSVLYVQRKDTSMWSVDAIFDEYGMRERLTYFQGFGDEAEQALETTAPPFLAVLHLGDEQERRTAEAILEQRFPSGRWQDSDVGELWNVRYFAAGGT